MKMKYETKLQRRKIYEKAIKELNKCAKGEALGLCLLLRDLCSHWMLCQFVPGHFPEMAAQKPKDTCGLMWWTDGVKAPRIKALKAAIKLTYK